MVKKIWYTYDDIHQVLKQLAEKIQAGGPAFDAMIAIGGGGFIPARILRCFLNIPIYAVTTAYYDSDDDGKPVGEVRKIQWLEPLPPDLAGKNVLIVDEVDDSRVTLEFVVRQLRRENLGAMGVAVLHEKIKAKAGKLPEDVHYFSGIRVQDWWINYPWDADDIEVHNRLARDAKP